MKYGYLCVECGNFDAYRPAASRDKEIECPECGAMCKRDKEYELQTCGEFDATSKNHVRYSSSMGINPKRIKEAERMYPGSKYTPDGRLEINSRQDKLKKMKARGLIEFE